jgi:hypothetical protein
VIQADLLFTVYPACKISCSTHDFVILNVKKNHVFALSSVEEHNVFVCDSIEVATQPNQYFSAFLFKIQKIEDLGSWQPPFLITSQIDDDYQSVGDDFSIPTYD